MGEVRPSFKIRVFWVDFIELEGGEGVSQIDLLEKSVPGRGHSQCKGSGAEVCLVCSRNIEEASVPRADWGGESRERVWTATGPCLGGLWGALVVLLSVTTKLLKVLSRGVTSSTFYLDGSLGQLGRKHRIRGYGWNGEVS